MPEGAAWGMRGERGAGRLAAVQIEQVFVNEDNSPI